MQTYQIEGKTFLVLNDELFVKVESTQQNIEPALKADSAEDKPKREFKRLTEDQKAAILADIDKGVPSPHIIEKYDISPPTYYNLKRRFQEEHNGASVDAPVEA